jgi:hypothetical protein
MDAIRAACLLCVLLAPAAALAGGKGLAGNESFVVLAADQLLADEILARAGELRRSLALEWLGEELEPGKRTSIHAAVTHAEDRGRTFVRFDSKSEHHMIWLNTSRERATGSTLAHEVMHVVLGIRFRGEFPAWADEGAASLQDDEERTQIRRGITDWMVQTGNWPNLLHILNQPALDVADQRAYATAVSLTEFLIARGGKQKFIEFASAGRERGWPTALAEFYRIVGISELQAAWQEWVMAQSHAKRTAAR